MVGKGFRLQPSDRRLARESIPGSGQSPTLIRPTVSLLMTTFRRGRAELTARPRRTRRRRSAPPRRRRHFPFAPRPAKPLVSLFPDRRFMFMAAATPRETLDASLNRISDDLIGLRETVDKMDHAQDALLVNGNSLRGQIETLSSLIGHMIEVLTPERPGQEGPSLADLLSRLITQQAALAGLMRQTLEIVTRLDPTVSAPANGAGRA